MKYITSDRSAAAMDIPVVTTTSEKMPPKQNSFAPLIADDTDEEQSTVLRMSLSYCQEDTVSSSRCSKFREFVCSRLLVILSVLGIILGFAIGFTVRPYEPSEDIIMWIGFPGEIFLSMLKMTILPLVITTIITATASMDPKQNGKIGGIQVTYLALTNLLGAVMGIILGVTVQPGAHIEDGSKKKSLEAGFKTVDIFIDLVRNIFPDNIVRATLQKKTTAYEKQEIMPSDLNGTVLYEMQKSVEYVNTTNVIGLIFACVIFGIAAGQAKEKGKAFLEFFKSASEIVMIIIAWFIWVSPIGICSLIASSVASITDLSVTFVHLGMLVAAVSGGLIVHQLIIMPLIHLVTVRTNPFTILAKSVKAWFMAFASASSAGAMPYMYEISEKFGVDSRVSSFCIPVGVNLNADGSALFICTSILFLAQLHGVVMDAAKLTTVCVLTTVSSLALPAVPSSSIVVIVIICTALAIPASSLGLLFTVEWLLDRLRTTSNVVTEIYAFLFVWHMTKDDIRAAEKKARLDDINDPHFIDCHLENGGLSLTKQNMSNGEAVV